jgi:hypothetical protein
MRSSTPSIANARLSCSIINQRLALRDLAGAGEAQGKPYYAFIDHSADTLQLNSIERPDMDQKDIQGTPNIICAGKRAFHSPHTLRRSATRLW